VSLRSFENTEKYLESDTYQLDFQLMTRMKERKKRGNIQHVSHSTVPQCADSLLVRWVRESSKTVTLQPPGKLVLL